MTSIDLSEDVSEDVSADVAGVVNPLRTPFELGAVYGWIPELPKLVLGGSNDVISMESRQNDGEDDQLLTDQGISSRRPLFNATGSAPSGVPSLTFDGANTFLQLIGGPNPLRGNGNHYLVEMFKPTTISTNDATFSFNASGGASIQRQAFSGASTYRYIGAPGAPQGGTISAGTLYWGGAGFTGTQLVAQRRGATEVFAAGSLLGTAAEMVLGGRQPGSAQIFDGEWFGFVVFDTFPTLQTRLAMHAWADQYLGL